MQHQPPHTRLRQILIFLLVLILLVVPGLIFLHQLFPAATAATAAIATAPPSQPELFLRALNPGYTVDGTRDVGEFIQLQRTTDAPLSLTGYSLRYTNASGKSVEIFTFADQSLMTGETLLLRLARTADPETADATYITTLAMSAGPLELLYQGEPIDAVCWTGQDHCADAFTSSQPTSLVRTDYSASFEHLTDYTPDFDPAQPSLDLPADPEDDETPITNSCAGLFFTELHSYYSESAAEQFLELHNPTAEPISLAGCQLAYKNKTYTLPHDTLAAGAYYAFYPFTIDLTLTKNPTSSNSLDLLNADGSLVDSLTYPHGQKKSTAYALVYDVDGTATWRQTYAITPAAENVYQQYRTCPAGKVINPTTGNCINASSASTELADCPPGKYRNPLTNRCKTIETTDTLKPCAEGYERNPETNRCRKITAENDGASFALSPTPTSDHSTFVALGIVALIVGVGVIYIIFQFRLELARAMRKARQRLHHILKHLFPRGFRFRRHK